ncbi:hypothetical protein CERZMDRAFT_121908, partial [Cercospora zeae-maydis SCOH1-5]
MFREVRCAGRESAVVAAGSRVPIQYVHRFREAMLDGCTGEARMRLTSANIFGPLQVLRNAMLAGELLQGDWHARKSGSAVAMSPRAEVSNGEPSTAARSRRGRGSEWVEAARRVIKCRVSSKNASDRAARPRLPCRSVFLRTAQCKERELDM